MTEKELDIWIMDSVGLQSDAMSWILLRLLKDSLDFLSKPEAKGTRRMDFIKKWQRECLIPEKIVNWMPQEKSNYSEKRDN